MINMVKDMKYIKKVTTKQILYLITLIILIGIPLLKLIGFYLQKYNVISSYDILKPTYIIYFTIPFQVYLYIKKIKVSNKRPTLTDFILYILILTTLTSSITAINPKIAFLGKDFRHEGFFTILTYYLLVLNWKEYSNKGDIKNLTKIILGITLVGSIYGLLQQYTDLSFILRYSNKEMTSGLAFNPNFFASLLVTSLGLTTSIYLTEEKYKKTFLFLNILFIVSLINTNSFGPLITLVIILIFLPIYLKFIKKLNIKKYLILLTLVIITVTSTIIINKNLFKINTCELCDIYQNTFKEEKTPKEDKSPSKSNENEVVDTYQYDISNGRIEIWKRCLKIIKQYPINGVGYDNFYLAYYPKNHQHYRLEFYTDSNGKQKVRKIYYDLIDNAHNVYLHNIVSTGFLGFIPYMLLLIITFLICLKCKNIILCTTFVAYSIQAFANINVIQVAPIYYIIIGLILSLQKNNT